MRWIGVAIIGLGGIAALVALGLWQLDRLDQKETLIARIDARRAAAPVPLPEAPTPADDYLAVTASGTVGQGAVRFVYSADEYVMVVPFETDRGRVMLDVGLTPAQAMPDLSGQALAVTGNLSFPTGSGALVPDQPNAAPRRDLAAMAALLDTQPVLIVARTLDPQPEDVRPLGVTTDDIPNNHLGYAIQWFGLALVWAGMTALLAWRMASRDDKEA